MNETVAHRIALALKRHGVEVIFGQSLPSAVILAAEGLGIRQISYRQENAGGTMADGFARISGKIAVVTAQNGPAATLLVPPLAEALKASIPVVALVQEVERPQADRNAFQELDHLALFQSCAKWVRRVVTAERIDDHVDAAFVAAGSGRPGPAVLLLPADLLRETAPHPAAPRRVGLGHWPTDLTQPTGAAIRSAAALIAEARSPVVMAGGGVHAGEGFRALVRLEETAHLPVFTTLMGKGTVDETHPLSCGVLGPLVGPRSLGRHTQSLLAEADLVLLVGTRTNQNGTDSWRLFPPQTRFIHIDVDPNEIGRNYEAVRLVGSTGPTLDALCDALERLDLSRRSQARRDLEARIAALWERFDGDRREVATARPGPLRPERIMAALQTLLTPDTIVAADASYSSFWVAGQLRASVAGMRFLTPRGLAGLGWGLPLAMGAKLARPTARVVTVVGDGGFAHSWAELETLARNGIALTVILLNNGILGFQKDAETVKFGAYTTACHFAPVDHAQIARACGCEALRIEDEAGLLPGLKRAMESDRPCLLEIMTDPAAHPPLSLFDGTLDRA